MAVTLSRSVVYFRTQSTVDRFAQIWRDASGEAQRLPMRRRFRAINPTYDVAQPSLVVHTAGRPASIVRYVQQRDDAYLHLQIGSVAFLMFDQQAYLSCAEVFRAAGEAREQLPRVDFRGAPTYPAAPALGGELAERAREELPVRPSSLALADALRKQVRLAAPAVIGLARLIEQVSAGQPPPGAPHPGAPPPGLAEGGVLPGPPAGADARPGRGPARLADPRAHPGVRASAAFAAPLGTRWPARPGEPAVAGTRRQGRLRLGLRPPALSPDSVIRRTLGQHDEGGRSR